MKKFLSIILTVIMLVAVVPIASAAEKDTVILYTNDVHCAIDDYSVLAAYRAELINQGKNVVLVDAGDAIQGEIIGAMTEGEAVVDIMNEVGYDYAVPGNHEFDYGMEVFLDLAQNKAEYEYISTNFHYLPGVRSIFEPYAIEDFGSYQIAFVGISTPETITKSTPEFFKDENGNFIYGFPVFPGGMTNEALYENVQESVDGAIADGADIVVAVGHTGILETTDGWKSTDIIANTDGIDYYIDAHSHETIENVTYKNINNEDVVLTSTGTKFANFGVLTISGDNASFELVNPDDVDIEAMSAQAKSSYNTVKAKVDGYNEDIAYLFEEIGTAEVKLVAYEDDKSWAVRKRETNAGDFVADAYRAVTGADVAIVNGGGIRANVEIGAVSRKNLMDVNAFNNDMCVIEVTGQQLVDVLEHGARECPDPIGGFFQVSGVTFEIHTYRETPVICDGLDNFIGMDETKERRVQNVLVGGEPVDLGKTYTLAGSTYALTQGGDGLTMLDGSTVVQKDGLLCDSEMLIEYFIETLGGVISEDMYGNPDGDGRINIVDSNSEVPDYNYEIRLNETITVFAPLYDLDDYAYIKFVPQKDGVYALKSFDNDERDPICVIFDADMEYLDENDDYNGVEFFAEYEFTAGKTYYFGVSVYSEEADINVTLVCVHDYEDGICTKCSKECNHELTELKPFSCECGEVFAGKDISAGAELEHDCAELDNEKRWYRFVPEESGVYVFDSITVPGVISDPRADLLNEFGEWLDYNDDYDGSLDFKLFYSFEAGETYYLEVFNAYLDSSFTVRLEKFTHTADDGSKHSDVEIIDETYSNCTEHGYSKGIFCNECEEFVLGHEEYLLDEGCHPDDDGDETCDLCGKENIYYCGHICHSENWFLNFIWTIANFIHSLFGISPVCGCGDYHYLNQVM